MIPQLPPSTTRLRSQDAEQNRITDALANPIDALLKFINGFIQIDTSGIYSFVGQFRNPTQYANIVNVGGAATITQLTLQDAGKTFTNGGLNASGLLQFILPNQPPIGYQVSFDGTALNAVSTLRVVPGSADRIYMTANQPVLNTTTAGTGSITNTLGGRIQSVAITLTYFGNGRWAPTGGYSFDWTVA